MNRVNESDAAGGEVERQIEIEIVLALLGTVVGVASSIRTPRASRSARRATTSSSSSRARGEHLECRLGHESILLGAVEKQRQIGVSTFVSSLNAFLLPG